MGTRTTQLEYVNNDLEISEKNMESVTNPFTPEQNVLTERMNRTLVEIAK